MVRCSLFVVATSPIAAPALVVVAVVIVVVAGPVVAQNEMHGPGHFHNKEDATGGMRWPLPWYPTLVLPLPWGCHPPTKQSTHRHRHPLENASTKITGPVDA